MLPSSYQQAANFPPPSDEATSVLIRRILSNLPDEDVRVGYLVRQFRRRSFAGLFIILALLGYVPVVSMLAGLVLLIPAFQLAAGYRAPLLPRALRQRRLQVERLRRVAGRALPWMERLEKLIRPRWLRMTYPPVPTIVGVLNMGLGIVIAIPMPFSNVLPGIALICLSMGYLQRDGLVLFVGLGFAVAGLSFGAVEGFLAGEALVILLQRFALPF